MPTPNDTQEKITALKDKITAVDEVKRASMSASASSFDRTFDTRNAVRQWDKYSRAWIKKVAAPLIVKAARAGYKVGVDNAK